MGKTLGELRCDELGSESTLRTFLGCYKELHEALEALQTQPDKAVQAQQVSVCLSHAYGEFLRYGQPWLQAHIKRETWRSAPWLSAAEVRFEVERAVWFALTKFELTRVKPPQTVSDALRACIAYWVRACLQEARRSSQGLSDSQRKDAPRVLRSLEHFRQQHGREPTLEERADIARELNLSLYRVEQIVSPPARRPRPGEKSDPALLEEVIVQQEWAQKVRQLVEQVTHECYGPQEATKFLMLLELNLVRGYTWAQIVGHLREPQCPISALRVGPQVYAWHEVCGYFSQPPPSLDPQGDRLLRWFHARWLKVVALVREQCSDW